MRPRQRTMLTQTHDLTHMQKPTIQYPTGGASGEGLPHMLLGGAGSEQRMKHRVKALSMQPTFAPVDIESDTSASVEAASTEFRS